MGNMKAARKRKTSATASASTTITTTTTKRPDPYPDHPRPKPEECRSICDDLLSLHGFPQEFAKYRHKRLKSNPKPNETKGDDCVDVKGEQSADEEEEDEEESVLDGLVKTVLSQNTTDVNCRRAFASLKSAFASWEDVLAADSKCIENAIRCGGLAPTKASCIKNILRCLLEKKGKLCMEYLRNLSIEEVKTELSHFKGIGPKTVACVLMFNLQLDDFPVDTHVFEIAKTIGWIPPTADRKKAYVHLNLRIPDELKFDLNCLLFTHGKLCHKCGKKREDKQKQKRDSLPVTCPLLNYCKTS